MAQKLALNYAEMCSRNGFPENFSALNGRPLKDTGYAWTVDVFLILCHEYLPPPA
jgi:putative isomerase